MEMIKTRFNKELIKGLSRVKTKKAVLLYSGGIDSTAAGIILKKQEYDVYPLFIDYGQSSCESEEFIVKRAAEKLGFNNVHVIRTNLIKDLSKSQLLGRNSINDSDAWVPARNTLFMVIAGIYAKQINADGICIGYMLDDNFVFGDNDYFHHKGMEGVLSKTFLQPMEVFLPIMARNKLDLVKLLHDLNILDYTVSCWNSKLRDDEVVSCHGCANCLERDNAINSLFGGK